MWLTAVGADHLSPGEHSASLKYAQSDAARFQAALRTQEAFNLECDSLMNQDVYARDALSEIAQHSAAAGPDDLLLIYFAGHGVIETVGTNAELFLAVHGTVLTDVQHSAISVKKLLGYMETSTAGAAVLLLDCCFSGNAHGRSILGPRYLAELQAGRRLRRQAPIPRGDGRILIGAAARGKVAHESATLGAGVFSHSLLSLLHKNRKRSVVTIAQLYASLIEDLNVRTSGQQIPTLSGDDSGAVLPTTRLAI